MKLLLSSLFISILALGRANGVPGSSNTCLKGIVIEAGTSETLPGVRVSVKGTDIFTYTDKEGNFELINLPAGEIEVSFSLVSFNAFEIPMVASTSEKMPLEVALVSR